MEISVFVYRQLLPFISKLCIWKRRKDLMPLFAAEQMFKDTAESSLSWHNFRSWNQKVLWAPRLPSPSAQAHTWPSCTPHSTPCPFPPIASPLLGGRWVLCPLLAFILVALSYANRDGGCFKGQKPGKPHHCGRQAPLPTPSCQGKLQQRRLFVLQCNRTRQSRWNTDGYKRHE